MSAMSSHMKTGSQKGDKGAAIEAAQESIGAR